MRFLIISIFTLTFACQPKAEKEDFSITDITPWAVLYHQKSAEVRALQLQTYNYATSALVNLVNHQGINPKEKAVVVDIDETILDNSPYTAKQVFTRTSYPIDWDKWVKLEQAKPIPGSFDFLKTADEMGFNIYYISNRRNHLLEATINNLNKFNYPQVSNENIMLRTDTSDKEPRREKVREKHEIVIMVGDNLGDFSSSFDGATNEKRNYYANEYQMRFGYNYFVLPNALYGAWPFSILEKNDSTDVLRYERIKKVIEQY